MAFVWFTLGGLLLLILVSGIYTFINACVRRKDVNWLAEDDLRKTPYKKYYQHILSSKKWLEEHSAQDIYVNSDDGLRLHGLWVPAEKPKGTIILAHGYRSTMLVDFGAVFEMYHSYGLNLLLPEQRSHGKSQGRYITFGVKESGDMQRWIAFHNDRFGELPLVLSGLSMGASTMMYLADKKLPDNVRGLIVDCGFTSPEQIISSVFRNVTHLPAVPSIYVAEAMARLFAGFSLWQEDSRKTLSQNRLPILMVHGKDDGFVPCKMTEQGYAVCTGPKKLLLVDGADHGVSFLVARDAYVKLVIEFLNENLEDAS